MARTKRTIKESAKTGTLTPARARSAVERVSKIQCPHCDFQDTRVIDSRLLKGKHAIRRQRECLSCAKQFKTYELRELLKLMVLKRDGSQEPFDRAKLLAGISKACAKRRVPEEEIEFMVDEIEVELHDRRRHEVTSRCLCDMVLVRLRRLDVVSYLRFASAHSHYSDVDQFQANLTQEYRGERE